jgi:predicted molibdopterin-dependent oxidoreductase YjgC
VRICSEKVGVHTLDFGYRGWKDRISADLNQPLGEASSCIDCGACFQACPTGAIWAKSSAYRGRPDQCKKMRSVCALCGVGCEIDVLVKNNALIRIDSTELAGDRGVLCYKGRFDQLYESHQGINTPLLRDDSGKLKACSIGNALDEVGEKFGNIVARYGKNSIAGIASSKASNESLKAFKKFMTDIIGNDLIDTIDGDEYRTIIQGATKFRSGAGLNIETTLEEILKADCLLVVGVNPLESQQVAGSYIFRAASQGKANLIVLDVDKNPFGFHASTWLKPTKGKEELAINALTKAVIGKLSASNAVKAKENTTSLGAMNITQANKEAGIDVEDLNNAAAMLAKSKHSVVVYGKDILLRKNPKLITAILRLASKSGKQNPKKPRVISLKPRGNSRGAWNLGLANKKEFSLSGLTKNGVKAVYLLLADDYIDDTKIIDGLKGAKFVVVQASYSSPVTASANVVLPSPTWAERKGSYTSLDGITKSTPKLTQPQNNIKRDEDIIRGISKRIKISDRRS